MSAKLFCCVLISCMLLAGCRSEPELPPPPKHKMVPLKFMDSLTIPLSAFPFPIANMGQAKMQRNELWLTGTGQSAYGDWDSFIYGPLFSSDDSAKVLFSRMIPRYRRGFNRFQMLDRQMVLLANAAVLHVEEDLSVQKQVLFNGPDTLDLSSFGLSQLVLSDKNGHPKYIVGVENRYAGFSGARFSKVPGAYAMYSDSGSLETYFGRYPDLFFEPGHLLSNRLSAITYHDQRVFVTHLGEESIHEYNTRGKKIRSYPLPPSKLFDPTLQYVSSRQLPQDHPSENPSLIDTVIKYSTHFITGFVVDQNIIHLLLVDRRSVDGQQKHKTIYRRWDMTNEVYMEDVLPIPTYTYGLLAEATEDTVRVFYLDRLRKKVQIDSYHIPSI